MIKYFERKLRLKDLEVWDIHCAQYIYRMFILDENRLPNAIDLDLPSDIIEEDLEEDLRKNLITISIYSKDPVKDEHIEDLDEFSKQLTDHVALAHCHVIVKFYTDDIDETFNTFLKEKQELVYEDIPLKQLWHLNQN